MAKDDRDNGIITYKSKRKEYRHRRIRNAIHSIKTNLPHLFTYKREEYRYLSIPNTTNACDGYFSHLKRKVEIHRGISFRKKQFLIEENLRN
ncbi:hypothetical protein FACS1894152_7230 [Bacilli bacterium]|nr:hypothetical protein FACS1894152_7230 [Bacilli bacterium]